MTDTEPTVTLGLPVYNGAQYLSSVLDCLLGQSYADFELLITDNASTDDTESICRDYASRDARIVYRRNAANLGIAANHNLLVTYARGRYFKWVASDDDYDLDMLSKCVAVIESAAPEVGIVYTQAQLIDESGAHMYVARDAVESADDDPAKRLAQLLRGLSIYAVTYGLMRTETLRRSTLYGLFPMSDTVLFAELSLITRMVELPEPLLRLRIHKGRSLKQHRTPLDRYRLFDPYGKQHWTARWPKLRVRLELVAAARRQTRGLARLKCVTVAAVLPMWIDIKNTLGPLKSRLCLRRSSGDPSIADS